MQHLPDVMRHHSVYSVHGCAELVARRYARCRCGIYRVRYPLADRYVIAVALGQRVLHSVHASHSRTGQREGKGKGRVGEGAARAEQNKGAQPFARAGGPGGAGIPRHFQVQGAAPSGCDGQEADPRHEVHERGEVEKLTTGWPAEEFRVEPAYKAPGGHGEALRKFAQMSSLNKCRLTEESQKEAQLAELKAMLEMGAASAKTFAPVLIPIEGGSQAPTPPPSRWPPEQQALPALVAAPAQARLETLE